MIHDFDSNGLGHLIYEGEHLNMDLVRDDLKRVNPEFHFYGNTREGCDILKIEELGKEIPKEEITIDNVKYAWSKPEKTYRGILYAVPRELNLENHNGLTIIR